MANLLLRYRKSLSGRSKAPSRYMPPCKFENIVTGSAVMFRLFDLMTRAAAAEQGHVLIIGERGVGKELVARGIHNLSTRRNNTFVTVPCGDLPSHLLEDELFGVESGTASRPRVVKHGLFEVARGGTLFLDEIGDLSADLQANLWRVIHEGGYRRLGGRNLIDTNFRVIAATSRSQGAQPAAASNDQDLLACLNAISIFVPPLREREGDVGLLAGHFLESFLAISDGSRKTLSSEAIEIMKHYRWPGNVRELQEVIVQTATYTPNSIILPGDLPKEVNHFYF